MKSISKIGVVLVIAIIIPLLLGAPVHAKAKVVWKLGGMYPEVSNYGQAFNKLSELVAEYSNGEFEVKVYHGAVLGKKMQSIENIQRGATDIHIETLDVFETYVPEVYYQSMPYLFRNVEHFRSFLASDWFEQKVNAKFKKRGFMVAPQQALNWERGPFRVLVCKIPILSVDDLPKIKMRVFASETYRKAWQTLGANTTNIDWTELYLALKQNMVQAVTSPINLVKAMKFTEVAPYIIRIDEFPQILSVLVNIKSYEKLTPFQKEALRKAYDEAGDYYRDLNYASSENDIVYMMENNGATFIRPSLPAWREKIKPFYKQLAEDGIVEKGWYEMVQSLK